MQFYAQTPTFAVVASKSRAVTNTNTSLPPCPPYKISAPTHADFLGSVDTEGLEEVSIENIQKFFENAVNDPSDMTKQYAQLIAMCMDTNVQPPVINFAHLSAEQQKSLYTLVQNKIESSGSYKLLTHVM